MARRLLIVLGPTAVGKTDFAIDLALKLGSPVISCDSRQIYKEMSIGTAVPDASQLAAVKHYFIQTQTARSPYSAGQYELDALALIEKLFEKGHDSLVMAGGSGFYVDAVCNGLERVPPTDLNLRSKLTERLSLEGPEPLRAELQALDPQAYTAMDTSNPQRVVRALEVCLLTGKPFSSFKRDKPKQRDFEIEKIGLIRPRAELYARINKRVENMMDAGLVEEARSLLPLRHFTALRTVGYKELFEYFDAELSSDKISLEQTVALIQQHTRNYAKRQLTWWRRDTSIRWKEM